MAPQLTVAKVLTGSFGEYLYHSRPLIGSITVPVSELASQCSHLVSVRSWMVSVAPGPDDQFTVTTKVDKDTVASSGASSFESGAALVGENRTHVSLYCLDLGLRDCVRTSIFIVTLLAAMNLPQQPH